MQKKKERRYVRVDHCTAWEVVRILAEASINKFAVTVTAHAVENTGRLVALVPHDGGPWGVVDGKAVLLPPLKMERG